MVRCALGCFLGRSVVFALDRWVWVWVWAVIWMICVYVIYGLVCDVGVWYLLAWVFACGW